MDEPTFEQKVEEGRLIESNRWGDHWLKRLYGPYDECPRCSEWKLGAYQEMYHEKQGFMKGRDWEERVREWRCQNCEAVFEV